MTSASSLERNVSAVVVEFLAEIGRPPLPAVDLHHLLEEDLGIYSLERLELILRLEQLYGVKLDPDATVHATTVADLADLVAGRRLSTRERRAAIVNTAVEEPNDGPPSGSVVFTAYAGTLVLAIGAGVWPILHLMPPGDRAARLLKRAVRMLFRAAGCRIDIAGAQHLDGSAPAMLVANHQSYLDSLVLLAALPLLPNIVVNERLPGAPFVGKGVRAARFLAVDRRTLATRLAFADAMTQALASGESLLVFPEATFDAGPDLLPFRLGAFAAAAAAGRPVIPITVRGTRDMLPCDARLLRRAPLSVTIHPPLVPQGTGWTEAVRLRAAAKARISRPFG